MREAINQATQSLFREQAVHWGDGWPSLFQLDDGGGGDVERGDHAFDGFKTPVMPLEADLERVVVATGGAGRELGFEMREWP